jgi:soluble lytic murein transglycosylase-like protein
VAKEGSTLQGHIFHPRPAFTLVLLMSALGGVSCHFGGPRIPAAQPRLERVQTILQERASRLSLRVRKRVANELARAEDEHGLDPLLLLAVIDQESRYDPAARGPKGALGLMQVRPFVAKEVAGRLGIPWEGPATLADPALNVRIGAAYLAEMRRMYAEERLALAAYNMGPYRVKRILAQGRAPKSRYAALVLEGYGALRQRFSVAIGPAAL